MIVFSSVDHEEDIISHSMLGLCLLQQSDLDTKSHTHTHRALSWVLQEISKVSFPQQSCMVQCTVNPDNDNSRRLKERRKHWLCAPYSMCCPLCACMRACDTHVGWLCSSLSGRAALWHTWLTVPPGSASTKSAGIYALAIPMRSGCYKK